MRFLRSRQKGQSLAEFAAVVPLLVLLVGGVVMAAFYGFRSAAADWAVFVNGVAAGSYDQGMNSQANQSTMWPDLRNSVQWSSDVEAKSARTWLSVENFRPGPFGANIIESYKSRVFFRLWRFYPGPQNNGPQ
jgi:hypothetical protein